MTQRIVHLSSVHTASDIRIFRKECTSLIAAGFDVTLVARPPRASFNPGEMTFVEFELPGSRAARILRGPIKMLRIALANPADLYHFHDPELIPVGFALKALRKRVVYDVHEDLPAQIMSKGWIPKSVRTPIASATKLIHRLANRVFDGIVVAREDAAAKFSGSNVVLVQNFPLRTEYENARERDAIPSRNPYKVVYVGGISEIRGIREMIAAVEIVAKNRPIQLELAGPFESSALRAKCENMSGWKYVKYYEWVEREQMSKILADSTLGLLLFHPVPNHVTSYPNKLFEYMSAKLPIVASDFPYWQQFIADVGTGLLVDPTSPQKIADAIVEIIDNPDSARNMGAAGAAAVREYWNWDAEIDKLISLYQRILD